MATYVEDRADYVRIVDTIERLGYGIVTRHILTRTPAEVEAEKGDEEIAYFIKSQEWMAQADVMVLEGSTTSSGVGLEAALALFEFNKPVILLYRTGTDPLLGPLKGVQRKKNNLQIRQYSDDASLERELSEGLDYAFRATPQLAPILLNFELKNYLDWLRHVEGESVAPHIRRLLEEDMDRNAAYQAFLAEKRR